MSASVAPIGLSDWTDLYNIKLPSHGTPEPEGLQQLAQTRSVSMSALPPLLKRKRT
jgi:hypothetical protein